MITQLASNALSPPSEGLARSLQGDIPLEIEIGSGKSRFLVHRAQQTPQTMFVGLERVSKWVRVAQRKVDYRDIGNIHVLKADARDWIERFVPYDRVSTFHIYFPDPWPKQRHRKRRLLTAGYMQILWDHLQAGGRVLFATDFENYFKELKALCEQKNNPWASIKSRLNTPFSDERERTHYEIKYQAEGRTLYYIELIKQKAVKT